MLPPGIELMASAPKPYQERVVAEKAKAEMQSQLVKMRGLSLLTDGFTAILGERIAAFLVD